MSRATARRLDMTVAILFSGGDAPGMNALLRVFVRLGLKRHADRAGRVLGIKDGYLGLVRTCERLDSLGTNETELERQLQKKSGRAGIGNLSQDIVRMDHQSVSGIVDRGGIILGSSRCEQSKESGTMGRVVRLLSEPLKVDVVVVVGGDGSLKGASELAGQSGMQVIGIPATIDNDFPLTERSLGFDTAVNTIVDAVRRVTETAAACRRIIVIETMGRESGQLAQTAALASGAEIVVTPDRGPLDPAKMDRIAGRIQEGFERQRTHAIVLVTEGVKLAPPSPAGPSKALADHLQQHFDKIEIRGEVRHIDVRHTVLGHLQRGGSPSAADRLLGAEFAEAAWNAIVADRPRSGVLGWVRGRVELLDFATPPLADREREAQRIYQLQKDISDHSAMPAT